MVTKEFLRPINKENMNLEIKNLTQLSEILKDDEKWVAGSTEIALYLDDHYPEHALLRSDPKLRAQSLEINQISNELGMYVRRWGLAHALSESDEPLEIMIGEKGYLRKFEKFSKPIIKSLVSKGYQLDSEKVIHAKVSMDEIIIDLIQVNVCIFPKQS